MFTELDFHLFNEGTHYEIYEKMGAHPCVVDGIFGVNFTVWAPNANEVSVVGDFNDWNGMSHPMHKIYEEGIYELFIPGLKAGDLYKYYIKTNDGRNLYKADPYANGSQLRPETASMVVDLNGYEWKDEKWLDECSKKTHTEEPMFIYEVHLGSWQKKDEYNNNGFYTYRELAPILCGYVMEMGYTHIEIIGLMEHPFDGSWGYQVTGYFAPTKRYGDAKDFMYFVDYMHQNGIGVLLDWVPAHFPRDGHGLANFDGSCVYEYADPKKGEHPEWGTKVFDYSKPQVCNFLIGSALFWVEKFHLDGLRVDAVASMLYLDYGRKPGQWVPNCYGGNGNLEAMAFLKRLNRVMYDRNRRAIVIAEESTAWPKISGEVGDEESMGFTFKWNMGWMHDFLDYMKLDPYFRQYDHNKMTFGIMYAYSERFILVLSHDEVVHLKASMINKMPGSFEDKFANLKLAYAFMLGHPGKKLLFMGQEFAQLSEWNEKRSLEWYLLNEPLHEDMQGFVKRLLAIYKENKALYEADIYEDGFKWIDANDANRSIFSFIRYDKEKKESLVFVLNFTPVTREGYECTVEKDGVYKVILTENNGEYGEQLISKNQKISFDLPGYGIRVLKFLENVPK